MDWHCPLFHEYGPALEEFKPDLIHAHDLSTLGVGVAWQRRHPDATILYDAHELEIGRNVVFNSLEEHVRVGFGARLIQSADHFICVSETIAERLQQLYAIDAPTVIPNNAAAIHSSDTLSATDFGLTKANNLILYIGSLAPRRGLENEIEAMADVKTAHLDIFGPGTATRRDALRAHAKAMGVHSSISLHPPVPKLSLVH